MKKYTIAEAAEKIGCTYGALQRQLNRDAKRPRKQRKYPHAEKIGWVWALYECDIMNVMLSKIKKQ